MTRALVVTTEPGDDLELEKFFRALAAWFGACYAAGLAIIIPIGVMAINANTGWQEVLSFLGGMFLYALFIGFFVALYTVLVWPVLVWIAKLVGVKRGFADLVLGALMGGGLISVIMQPLQNGGEGLFFLFAAAGAVGGLTYWWLAGKPN
ncbi:hypothetical protein [Maricaulis sp.]|uniref:hypothetical protein n=1 Tax=unclassified Maricaulis TaxID=2632371 RepID=UPI001B00657C|nr:hypothetical protein [Maricaulis sp.]MBO6797077.1 hypothetical protein [Maricaulis sp.]